MNRTETTSFLRATGFSTRSSRSGLARVSRLLSLAVGLWKEIVLLWLVGLGVIQALVGPVSRGGDGGVQLSLGRESCDMACRGSSRVLGVLGEFFKTCPRRLSNYLHESCPREDQGKTVAAGRQ